MIRSILILCLILLLPLALVYWLHIQFIPDFAAAEMSGRILPFYLLNLFMSFATGTAIIYLSNRKSSITGFVFMAGSLIKFALFFLLFYSDFSDQTELRRVEFISFYTPYSLCLFIEVWYLIRHLNKSH